MAAGVFVAKEFGMNKQCWIAVLCLGFVSLLGGDRLWAADSERQQLDQLKAKMQKDGWKEIAEGVFERKLGPNKVERLGHGREGLEWTVGELTRRLEFFQKEKELYPSEKLDKIIGDLTWYRAKSRRALWDLDHEVEPEQGLSSLIEAAASCSSICYSATADAYHLTTTQGVGAVANASFNSACGYSGETYAYSYARATLGTTTTTHSQSDPDYGTSITSSASSTVNGGSVTGIPCYSEASSYAVSNGLGISYSTSDVNDSYCPPVACTVTITGTSSEYFSGYSCRSRTWSVSLSSGCPAATTYQWTYNGTAAGTASTYTRNVCAGNYNFNVGVAVNSAYTDQHVVTVAYDEPPPCECCNLPPGYQCP
jgi:hypothetical protein